MNPREFEESRRARTLDELEGRQAPPQRHVSHLISTCLRLRQKPIGELTVEDLRIMIGQNIGLVFLLPLALDVLEENPLTEGDFFPGDLLYSVMRADPGHWQRYPSQRARLLDILEHVEVPEEVAGVAARWRRRTS